MPIRTSFTAVYLLQEAAPQFATGLKPEGRHLVLLELDVAVPALIASLYHVYTSLRGTNINQMMPFFTFRKPYM
jgi:hypothetical protein